MDIPETCRAWAEMMEAGSDEERRILGNLRSDPCVDDAISSDFFDRLEAKGVPSSPKEARTHSFDVIKDDPESFTCGGRTVPDEQFRRLL